MQEFSRHHWHFTAETSMPKRKYQGMVWGRLPTQCVLNKMVLPLVFQRLPAKTEASLREGYIWSIMSLQIGVSHMQPPQGG